MKQTIQIILVAGVLSAGYCARGSVWIGAGDNGGYPSASWDGSKAFSSMYGFSWNTGGGMKIYSGHSSPSSGAYASAAANPSTTVCATPSGWKHDPPRAGAKDVPVFTLTGDGDFGTYDVTIAQQANALGHRESVAWHRGHEHNFSEPELVYIFWQECIRLRYPPGSSAIRNTSRNQGWLGDMDNKLSWETDCPYIAPYNQYARDKNTAAWFPTRYFAFCWRAYVPGKGRTSYSPIVLNKPRKTGQWSGWPTCKEGDIIDLQVLCSGKNEDKVVFYDGDIPISSHPRQAYGIYNGKWKAVAGIRGILAVAYRGNNIPIATSRLCPVIVQGTVKYPAVDNSPLEDPNGSTDVNQNYSVRPSGGKRLPAGIHAVFQLNGRTVPLPGAASLPFPIVVGSQGGASATAQTAIFHFGKNW